MRSIKYFHAILVMRVCSNDDPLCKNLSVRGRRGGGGRVGSRGPGVGGVALRAGAAGRHPTAAGGKASVRKVTLNTLERSAELRGGRGAGPLTRAGCSWCTATATGIAQSAPAPRGRARKEGPPRIACRRATQHQHRQRRRGRSDAPTTEPVLDAGADGPATPRVRALAGAHGQLSKVQIFGTRLSAVLLHAAMEVQQPQQTAETSKDPVFASTYVNGRDKIASVGVLN